jgi:hypothetical protein
MTVEANPGASASAGLVAAHKHMLGDASLQFAFRPVVPPKPPAWLKPLLELLVKLAPVLMYVFWALVAVGLLLIAVMIARELLRVRWPDRFGAGRGPQLEPEDWRPTAAQALALL